MESTKKKDSLVTQRLLLEGIIWSITVVIAWWWTLTATGEHLRPAILLTSVLSMAAGIRGFLGHGQGQITATGLFSLSTAMFIGYAGFVLANEPAVTAGWQYVALAAVVGLTAQIFTTAFAWGRGKKIAGQKRWFNEEHADWAAHAGLLILVVSAVLHVFMPQWRSWIEASAFTAICLLVAGLILRKKFRIFSSNIVVGFVLILYAEFFHAGTGRLRLVALACSVVVIYSLRFQQRRLKRAIVALVPLALVWLANDRLELQESLSTGASAGRTGLESMIAPLNVFSLFLRALQEQGFTPSYGYNLLSVPALIVPESIWPSQPRALGYELVVFFAPEKYGDGIYSTVATSTGEGLYNFGWWGLPFVIIVAASALRLLDGLLTRRVEYNPSSILGILSVVLIAMLSGAVADYTWSGTHTYAARMLSRLPVFFVVLAIAWAHVRVGDKKLEKIPSGHGLSPQPSRKGVSER